MLNFLRNFTGIIFSLLVIGGSFVAFSLYVATRSDLESGTVTYGEFVRDSIEIYRNQFSVPHIIAKSEADAFFAIGYVHAQDRLWQMDVARRAGEGRLSEIFGKEALETDKFLRTLDLNVISKNLLKSASKQTRFILEQYSNGINAYVDEHKTGLPFEFGALGYTPEPWEPHDCLLIGRMMAFEMSMSFWSDIAFGEIADKLGADRASELIPSYPSGAPVVVPQEKKTASIPSTTFNTLTKTNSRLAGKSIREFGEILTGVRRYLGMEGSGVGSNSWVMRTYSPSGNSAILANDPHLTLALPARWYQAHVTAPTLNITGLTIPGIPLFISGRNDKISWGITNMMADDCDFYVEKIDATNPNYYTNDEGKRVKFRYRRDTIIVRADEAFIYDMRFTKRSAIISDAHAFNYPDKILNFPRKEPNHFLHKYGLSFSWTAQQMSDEVLAMYRINKANTWQEFLNGANLWGAPAMNFSYADVRGNIGIAPSGIIPIRTKCTPNIPNPGWLPEYAWQGYHTASELPNVYNPLKRYVFSANNKTTENPPFYISSLWEPPSRSERIEETLKEFDEYAVRDAQFMQLDVTSPLARTFLKKTLPVIAGKQKYLSPTELAAFKVLKRWDGIMNSRDAQPAIFSTFFNTMLEHTFADELGDRLYRQYSFISNIPTRKIMDLLQDSSSVWFDDVQTKVVESKDEIIFRSFVLAVRSLESYYASAPMSTWKYGDIHQLTLNHLFSKNPYMKQIVTQGPFPTGGNNSTLNCGEYHYFAPHEQIIGASMRMIADMRDSVIYTVLAGGNSGEPLSAHYTNQLQLWLNGGYIRIPVKREPDVSFIKFTTILPEKLKDN
ncbi:MAG: penicillin acylase family protein [Ignavibacteria bacterium]|nr:penicillin acylase family protein [Ignavibacteria bacterium]